MQLLRLIERFKEDQRGTCHLILRITIDGGQSGAEPPVEESHNTEDMFPPLVTRSYA